MARKGVSPVLASLLLVVIVVAAAIATYLWVSSYIGSARRGVEAPQFRELLKVEGVRAEGGSVVVTVRNIGNAKATLRAAYVMKGDVAVASETLNVELEPGQAAEVRVSAQVPPGSYTVKIVTATGVETTAPLPLSGAAQQPAQPKVTLTVSVEPPEGGTTNPSPGEYGVAAGSAVTVRAEPNPGYAFSKWLLNGSDYSTSQEVNVTVRGPTSLTAVFSKLQPRFTITYWNQTITGPAGSKQRFVAEIENVGSANGTVEVRVLDSTGALVNSTQIVLQPGQRGTAEMLLTLPSTAGTYTWIVEAFNTATESVDDRKSFTVTVLQATELVRNGDFSEGSAYWTLEDPWSVAQQYARAYVETNKNFTASIYQDVEIPAGTTSLTLSFSYYLAAHPPGQVNQLTLKAYLLSGGNVVWESSTIQWDGSRTPVWKQFAQTFTVSVTGRVTLRITLTADVKRVGLPASIDAGLDNISLVASAPP